jgi:signal transduction histidine kinase
MQQVSATPLTKIETPRGAELCGRWRVGARAVWYGMAALALAWLSASIPAYLFSLGVVTTGERAAVNLLGSLLYFSPSPLFEFWMDVAVMFTSLGASVLSLALAFLLFYRKPNDAMALLVSFTLLLYGVIMTGPAEFLLDYLAHASSLAIAAQGVLWVPFEILFFVFPNGVFVPRWTRWLALLLLPYSIVLAYQAFASNNLPSTDFSAFMLLYTAISLAAPLALIYRYVRAADRLQRLQIKWVGLGITLLCLSGTVVPMVLVFLARQAATVPGDFGFGTLAFIFLGRLAWWAGLFALPSCFTIAILGYRLFDIDLILNRAFVYGALTALVIGMYIVVVGGLGALFQSGSNLFIALLATGLIAVIFQPLRERLQRAVNRLMYGERDDPYAVLSRLGARLEATLAPDALLPALVETVAQALKLPYVAIEIRNARKGIRTEWGQFALASTLVTFPLVYQHETIGALVVAPRAGDEILSTADRHLLETIANQAALAAHTVTLTSALQHSRERLVAAREEERRRIRRDLHDGLGPALAGITLKLDAARNHLPPNADASAQLLKELRAQAQSAITDIRRLVYDLRPPTLDELGLADSLREYATCMSSADLTVSVSLPDALPPLSAAVEVAAYRITTEALTNVVRHAHARHCHLTLRAHDALELEIRDDGVGLPQEYRAGVGLTSMRERAAELGGTCRIANARGGGTCVIARLPITRDL